MLKYCLIIPHYNHERQFLAFLPKLIATELPIIVVDDGSSEESLSEIKQFVDLQDKVHLVEHHCNRGKGAAVRTAFSFARAFGFTHAIQVDADGQHNVDDIQRFIAASEQQPQTFICGKPTFDVSAPKARLYGRRVTDFWVALETLSLDIKDGLCGFRVYPLRKVEQIIDTYFIGARMDFDTEVLVKARWLNIKMQFIETAVVYPENSVSHFHYLRDNLLLVKLHTRLMFGMVVRLPWILARRLGNGSS